MSKPGNINAQKFGAESAVKAIQKGEPLRGLAQEAELAVIDEYQEHGASSLIERNATRLQAATDLYWDAICKASQDKDIEKMDRYVARFGWLAGKTLGAWDTVKKDARTREDITAIEVLAASRSDNDKDK